MNASIDIVKTIAAALEAGQSHLQLWDEASRAWWGISHRADRWHITRHHYGYSKEGTVMSAATPSDLRARLLDASIQYHGDRRSRALEALRRAKMYRAVRCIRKARMARYEHRAMLARCVFQEVLDELGYANEPAV